MNLIDWIDSKPFEFKKINVRPWGGFELSVSKDATNWIAFSRPFGSGFSEKEAFESLLIESLQSDILRPQLTNWIGEEWTKELQELQQPQVTDVSEHIHNE